MEVETHVNHIAYLILVTHGIKFEAVKGKSRKAELVHCRYLFSKYMRENTDLSFEAIGNFINRNYTTVIYYLTNYQPLTK